MQSDPSLTARILQLANSPYFGLSGKIGSLDRAVVALGGSVIRSLAVSTAAGMFGGADEMPDGFWRHSVTVAAGASIAARIASVPAGVDPEAAFRARGLTAVHIDGLVQRTAEEAEALDGLLAAR